VRLVARCRRGWGIRVEVATHLHCDGCKALNCGGIQDRRGLPRSDPSPEWVLRARAEGRAECVSILLAERVEDFGARYAGRVGLGRGGQSLQWCERALRELFQVEDVAFSLIDQANAVYWEQQARIDTLERRLAELMQARHERGAS
jgi:hypothetical protein